jgi:hypothetical protein
MNTVKNLIDFLLKEKVRIISMLFILFFFSLSSFTDFTSLWSIAGDIQDVINKILPLIVLSVLTTILLQQKLQYNVSNVISNVRPHLLLLVVFFFSLIAIGLLSQYVFQDYYIIPTDENSYLFQAKTFAKGRLFVESHPLGEFFEAVNVVTTPSKVFGKYPPGHALFLMWGVLIGYPRLIPLIISSLTLFVIFFLAKEAYDSKTAKVAALFALLSPAYLFTSSTLLSQTTSLFLISLGCLFFIKTQKSESYYFPFISGACLGLAFNTRPLNTIALSIPFSAYFFYLLIKYKGTYWKKFLLFSLALLIFLGIFLSYNHALTGNAFLMPFQMWGNEHLVRDRYGFGTHGDYTHDFDKGLTNTRLNLRRLNEWLFGWPCSILFICALFFFYPLNKWDYIFFSGFLLLVIAYLFWWWAGEVLGPLYYYDSLVFLVVLSARGFLKLTECIDGKKSDMDRTGIMIFTIILFLFSFLKFYPEKIKETYNYVFTHKTPVIAIQKINVHNAIVFITFLEGGWFKNRFYVHNSPDLNDDILFARNLGKRNKLLMDYYPDRNYYIYSVNKDELQKGKLLRIKNKSS